MRTQARQRTGVYSLKLSVPVGGEILRIGATLVLISYTTMIHGFQFPELGTWTTRYHAEDVRGCGRPRLALLVRPIRGQIALKLRPQAVGDLPGISTLERRGNLLVRGAARVARLTALLQVRGAGASARRL